MALAEHEVDCVFLELIQQASSAINHCKLCQHPHFQLILCSFQLFQFSLYFPLYRSDFSGPQIILQDYSK